MPDGQTLPQTPQLSGSLVSSTQTPEHACWGGVHPPASDETTSAEPSGSAPSDVDASEGGASVPPSTGAASELGASEPTASAAASCVAPSVAATSVPPSGAWASPPSIARTSC